MSRTRIPGHHRGLPAWGLVVMLVVGTLFIAVAFTWAAVDGASGAGNWNSAPEEATFTYLGHPLHCLVTEDGAEAGNIGALSCDFARYWRSK